jgi:hypothetical protein
MLTRRFPAMRRHADIKTDWATIQGAHVPYAGEGGIAIAET